MRPWWHEAAAIQIKPVLARRRQKGHVKLMQFKETHRGNFSYDELTAMTRPFNHSYLRSFSVTTTCFAYKLESTKNLSADRCLFDLGQNCLDGELSARPGFKMAAHISVRN